MSKTAWSKYLWAIKEHFADIYPAALINYKNRSKRIASISLAKSPSFKQKKNIFISWFLRVAEKNALKQIMLESDKIMLNLRS